MNGRWKWVVGIGITLAAWAASFAYGYGLLNARVNGVETRQERIESKLDILIGDVQFLRGKAEK